METKQCRKCGETKPRNDFYTRRGARDGLHSYCRQCIIWARVAWGKQNRDKELVCGDRYRRTVKGCARGLRADHGFEREESIYWAKILCAADTRCACCGVPNWRLRRMKAWRIGGERVNRRLSVDHVVPGEKGDYRPLCYSCNRMRGAAVLSDAEVLGSMRAWYIARTALRNLYWLNTHVENGVCVGGRPYRNEFMQRKFEKLKEVA